MEIRPFQSKDRRSWDNYVWNHPHGSPFHLIAWKNSIEETFGFPSHYLAAWEGKEIRGLLPLSAVRNFLMGKVLLSAPFAVYGGILADTDQVRQAIFAHVKALAESTEVNYVELRNAYPEQCVGLPKTSRHVTFTHPVGQGPEAIMNAAAPSVRNKIRKALRHPYASRQTSDITAFEELYAKNLRRLGTPVLPRSHFSVLMRNFHEIASIREVTLEGKVVAASFNFCFRDQVHTFYAAADPELLAKAPNNFLYFDNMRWAGENGFAIFDFGRSKKTSGQFEFKRHWGTTMRELPYEILLVKDKELPNFSPNNPKFDMPIKLWQRLPLGLTRALGPSLSRLFP